MTDATPSSPLPLRATSPTIGAADDADAVAAPLQIEPPLSNSTPGELTDCIATLRRAQTILAQRRRESIVESLAAVVDAWLAPGSSWMARAERGLAAATDFSLPMIRFALPTMLAPLRTPALAQRLAAEVGGRRGPQLILHVLPGNLPGLAAIPAALSLAIGSAALLKAGRGDRVVPALFAESIAAQDAELGRCLAACYWSGGDRACEDIALAAADLVVAAGNDATIADLRARCRGRLSGHGHRLSFAVVTREVLADPAAAARAAANLTLDTAMWDQRGCLSPQLCFVEGDFDSAIDFGARTIAALSNQAQELPPARLPIGDRLAVRKFRDEAEWEMFAGERVRLFALDNEAAGTVRIEARPALRPSPLGRSLRIMPIGDFRDLAELLAPGRRWLEGAGLGTAAERWADCATLLAASGVHRVAPLGELQRPPLEWRQGGRPRVGDWVSEGSDAG